MKRMFTWKFLLLAMFFVTAGTKGRAQLSITSTGTAFTQNFDGMGNSATATLPAGFKIGTDWASGTTATTVAFGTSGTGAVTGSSSGGVINWANGVTASATDRSLGFLNTGSFTSPKSIVLKLTNNTGSTIGSLSISFDYEKSRSGSRQFDWTFFHGSASAPTTSASSGDQSYPADANNTVISNPPLTTSKSVTITGLSIPNGSDYYLKWTFTGLSGSTNGQGIGIDNFSITAIAAVSSDASLSNLVLSAGSLSPTFSTATTSYTAAVANSVSSITITPTSSESHAVINVNGNTVSSGSPSSSIALAEGPNTITTLVTAQDGTTTQTYTITVTRAAAGVATLTTSSPLADFGNVCINTTAGPNSFTIDGSSLDGSNISIAALPGFSYSEAPGGPFTGTLNISYSAPGFTNKTIYVDFNPTAVQSYNGNIALSGGGLASSYNIPVTGSGINSGATVVTGGSSAVMGTTATASGTISAAGCSATTAYGIEYSSASGFPDGAGTQVASTNLSGGNFSSNITGLVPNTKYYYKAYVTSSAGTVYGTQQSFTCTPAPVKMSDQPGFSYTEDFSAIASWGTFFNSGQGDSHLGGLSASAAATPIPSPAVITASSISFNSSGFLGSGGVQKGTDQPLATPAGTSTGSIVLLSTGSPDNTTSTAIDFYMDFTGLNAGVFSFDYQTLNNGTATATSRNGSLRVYATTDGINFTELTDADVLNFTNFSPISGSKTNIALPTSFNGSATARLRFYYHNGSGGAGTGSRPKISIDNLNVTAVATVACAAPTAAPANLVFGAITDVSIAGSFAAASPAADQYLVIASVNNSLTAQPVNGQIYDIGDNVGDGTVVAKSSSTSFTATGLSASTPYYFFIYSVNSICTGGPLYLTSSVLTGTASTIAGLPSCTAPASQPTSLNFTTSGVNSISGSFAAAAAADEYLVLVSTSATLSVNPTNASSYSPGDVIGNAKMVQSGSGTGFTATGLLPNTQYNFFVMAFNSQACVNGPAYNSTSPLTGVQTTMPLPACTTPTSQPTVLSFNASNTKISGAFSAGSGADDYVVIMSTATTLSADPVNGTDYAVGASLGGGTVVANSPSLSFLASGLTPGTIYYFFVYATNKNCSGGTQYLTTSPLTGNNATTNVTANSIYFGNLHAHSDYSDGNKDNPTYTPADDYQYAMTAQCLDYLGISEHNHFSSPNNPGNKISTYHLGISQADAFTTANPGFLAMYGMEWGVISGGGHVVVYGDGMNNLLGWESGSGGWGTTNNYDVYVPKSVYTGSTGLFKTIDNINDTSATNTFGTLAHPNQTDYNNIAGIAYDADADAAITGSAVESGPATSTNTSYSDPGSSMYYLWYFQTLLSKGYHLGPTIDHDNHNTTFGHTTRARTAIIAPGLTKTEIIKGMRNMHFYATEDCDTKVDFTLNTQIMGSVFTGRGVPNISVALTDATTNLSNAVIRLMYGVPGSNILPVKIDSAIGSSLNFTDNSVADATTGYYYIDITNGSSRIVTSPIWYKRDDNAIILPVTLTSFTAQKANTSVKLNWATAQETNSSHFVIERSLDGASWKTIGNQTAAGNSAQPVYYEFYDNAPTNGINYYRLKQVDFDGKSAYSATRSVLFASRFQISVSPNPARDFINLYVTNTTNETYHVQLTDTNGKLLQSINSSAQHLQINTATLAKGVYFIRFVNNSMVSTQKVVIE